MRYPHREWGKGPDLTPVPVAVPRHRERALIDRVSNTVPQPPLETAGQKGGISGKRSPSIGSATIPQPDRRGQACEIPLMLSTVALTEWVPK